MSTSPVRLYRGAAALALALVLGGLRGEPVPGLDDTVTTEPLGDGSVESPPLATRMPDATSGTRTTSPAPAPPAPSSPSSPSTAATPVAPPPTPDQTASSGPTAPAVSPDEDRRRRYRRRYRNRYPGPIPTPEEWEPPEGPVRIALQAGHWRASEAPSELSGLRDNGTRWNDVAEWEANLAIARRAGAMLDSLGYVVDILPAVVPPGYRAHLFIAIHADGSGDPRASGYRVAAPRRDATGRADTMARLLQERYGTATGLRHLNSATRRMRNYYAFNFRRYEHALHPMTIAVILETGFLTSARDRSVILDDPDRAAAGIVEAVRSFPVTSRPVVVDDR